jgi:hypothetical protein
MYRASRSRALLAFACSFLLAAVAFSPRAQAAEKTGEDARANSLYPGSWSLQFQITDEIGLKPFNGMIVSAKRHFSEHSALRLGLHFDVDWDDGAGTGRHEVEDTLADWYDSGSHKEYQEFTIDLSYLNYPSPGSYVNLFWGVGPLVSFYRSEANSDEEDPNYGTTARRDYSRSWDIGALGLIGAEWFLAKRFSFHSEYRASVIYGRAFAESARVRSYPGDITTRTVERSESDGWALDGNVILGLSVYF